MAAFAPGIRRTCLYDGGRLPVKLDDMARRAAGLRAARSAVHHLAQPRPADNAG